MAALMPQGKQQYFTAGGIPLVGGKVYTYAAGTTTPLATYTTAAASTPNTNPVILDSRGEASIFFSAANYKIVVKDSLDSTIWTQDNLPGDQAATIVANLAASTGSSLVGHIASGTGAVATTVQGKLRQIVSVKDFGAVGDGSTDDTTACQAAVTAVIAAGGGTVYFPAGTYLLNGTAGADSYTNGILIPFGAVNVYPLTSPVTLLGVYGGSTIKAGSNGMILIRNSRNHTQIKNLTFDGNSKTSVIGIGNVPESIVQNTTLVSNGYSKIQNVAINDTAIGIMYQPGPTVTGSDSGCFYHEVDNYLGNQNNLHMWFAADSTAGTNRTTRTVVSNSVMARGNTGVLITKGTEIDFISCNFEHFSTASANGSVLPSATPTCFNYADTNPANIRLIGGYAEDCDKNIVSASGYSQVALIGFSHTNTTDATEAGMLQLKPGRMVIPRSTPTGTPSVYIAGIDTSYAGLVIDPDADGSKTIKLQTNGSYRMGWFNGITTHYGSAGNVVFAAGGNDIAFTYAAANNIANPTGAAQINKCDHQYWRSVAGTDVVRLDTVGTLALFPASDNAVLCGQTGFRWSAVWAANGTIQTSDPRTKRDVIDSPLGLDFINALRPVAYKFKVGGNKIVGVRETKPAVFNDDGDLIESAETENVIEPQPGKRQHFGFLTTEVKAALGDVDFGGYIKTNPNDPESEEALRYDEFIAPLVRAVQELTARVKALEAK